MTFVTPVRTGAFEVRESRTTPDGPRSRTLASFRELDEATIEKVIERAENPPTREDLGKAALRAGATVAGRSVDGAARDLLRSLARGETPSPMHRRLLLEALGGESMQAAEWLGVPAAERGEALEQLLLLADAVPIRRRPATIDFPRLDST
jgi:plasmid stability protein